MHFIIKKSLQNYLHHNRLMAGTLVAVTTIHIAKATRPQLTPAR